MRSWRFGVRQTLKVAVNKIYRHPIYAAFIISGTLLLLCSLTLVKELNLSFAEALLKMLPLLFGELGDIEWNSRLAKLAGAVGLFSGVAFISIVGAGIVSWFVNLSLKGGRIMERVTHKNHFIICGWNIQGVHIVKQLLSPDIATNRPIVILANLPERPHVDPIVDFVSGDPTKEEDLKRAGIMTADTVIVLTEFNGESGRDINPDAQAVLITLAVESMRRDVYTCVQLFNSEYKKHLERAHVDEYICLDRLSGNLLVSSALNHGLSAVVGELLEFTGGSEFYKKDIPQPFIGMGFRAVAKHLLEEGMILVAVETEESVPLYDEEGRQVFDDIGKPKLKKRGTFVINPPKNDGHDYIFKPNDRMFFIAVDEPTEKEMTKIGARVGMRPEATVPVPSI